MLEYLAGKRFTPVRTGKRSRLLGYAFSYPVHPRAYGEELKGNMKLPFACGSPPCVRGRERIPPRRSAAGRFTPVRTGKRPTSDRPSARSAVHPRAYGEENSFAAEVQPGCGSPPCVRGRAVIGALDLDTNRFTPVRPGKRFLCLRMMQSASVHPRAYGEETADSIRVCARVGSPPCVRGRGSSTW